jgi:hypothetical protein
LSRLHNTNSAQRICDSVQMLLEVLDIPFEDLRPGLLLSRVRSLEADGAAFDTEDARAELFPDAFSRVADTVNTARDLLGMFPEVRRVEVERVALDLHRRPDALPIVEQQANEIEEAAQKSGAATKNALQALARNDVAINAAADPVLRNELVADRLLVTGNFARAVAEKTWSVELVELGADSWQAVRENLPAGVGVAARVLPLMALMMLTVSITGAVAGIAAAVPAWKSLAAVFSRMSKARPSKGAPAVRSKRSPRARRSLPKREARKPALPKQVLEAFLLHEAKKTPQWAHLDVLQIKPGPAPGSWEIAGWGQLASKPARDGPIDIQNVPILEEIAKRLNEQFALHSD